MFVLTWIADRQGLGTRLAGLRWCLCGFRRPKGGSPQVESDPVMLPAAAQQTSALIASFPSRRVNSLRSRRLYRLEREYLVIIDVAEQCPALREAKQCRSRKRAGHKSCLYSASVALLTAGRGQRLFIGTCYIPNHQEDAARCSDKCTGSQPYVRFGPVDRAAQASASRWLREDVKVLCEKASWRSWSRKATFSAWTRQSQYVRACHCSNMMGDPAGARAIDCWKLACMYSCARPTTSFMLVALHFGQGEICSTLLLGPFQTA